MNDDAHSKKSADIASLLDALSSSACDPWDLLQKLGQSIVLKNDLSHEDQSIIFHYIERAFAYTLVEDHKHLGAVVIGRKFSSEKGDWPPSFDKISAIEKNTWNDVANLCEELLPCTHLLDLTLSSGVRNDRVLAEKVASSYLSIVDMTNIEDNYQGLCLRRAWSLARQFNLPGIEAQARQTAFTAVQTTLNTIRDERTLNFHTLKITFHSFEILTVEPRNNNFANPSRRDIYEALIQFRDRVASTYDFTEHLTDLAVRVAANDVERDTARRSLIQHYLNNAETESEMLASSWYEKSAHIARQYGYRDLYEQAIQAMQDNPLEDQNLLTVSTTALIPRYIKDWRLANYRYSRSIFDALDIWLTTSSPIGHYNDNLEKAKKLTQESIQSLATRITYEHGLPVRVTSGIDNAVEEQLHRIEACSARLNGLLLAAELKAIKAEHEAVGITSLVTHLTLKYKCNAELARAFCEALVSFWEKRYSDSGRAAFPLVEAGVRGLLLLLGIPLYRIQTGNSGGKFPSLEKYAEKLETIGFDIDWLRCLRNPVLTLRNALSHGHRHFLEEDEASILLRMAALFVILTPDYSSKIDRAEIEIRLRDPINWVAAQANLIPCWRQGWSLSWKHSDTESS